MSYTSFDLSIEDHIAHLQLNRPEKRNCMTAEFWDEVVVAVNSIIESGDDVRVMVISSTGPHFTSGIDLAMFGGIAGVANDPKTDPGRLREALRRKILRMQETFSVLDKAPFPVMVAIQGGCIGGGIDMVTACDTRYATRDSFYTIKEIDIGMTADVGTLQRIQNVMPSGLARELAYTGRNMDAEEALQCGFVTKLFDDYDALIAGVMETARNIAAKSPLAITGCKEMLNYARDNSVQDSLNYMAAWNAGMLINEDLQKAAMANMSKSVPEFSGKIAKV